ncbi:MAG: hypothetical protein DRI69_03810 [Bacteroidetes bacterium]|nr:MAG: hypothetical protein DRI69_03810 [Bacteroidota bacterium]
MKLHGLNFIGIVLAGALVGTLSCLDVIHFPAPAGVEEALVFQGTILKGNPSVVRVQVNQLFDFTAASLLPVCVKVMELEDVEGNTVRLPEVRKGLYEMEFQTGSQSVEIVFGNSYRLHTITHDGREYMTSFEPLHDVPKPDSIVLDTIEIDVINSLGELAKKKKFLFSINTPIIVLGQAEKSYLKWDIERTYKLTDSRQKVCYITEYVVGTALKVLNGSAVSMDHIEEFPLHQSSIIFPYAEGLYMSIYQQSLSAGAYEYWDQIVQLVVRTGNMFEPRVGTVVTNFRNVNDPNEQVFGYFYATTADTIRIYISPEDANFPKPFCPIESDICANCLSTPRSTLTKPDYWIE